jgi:uncharacterized protein YndB with AHSA1/START domain
MTDSLSLEFDLDHPPEKVWRALTDPVLLAEWILPVAGFELAPGAAFTFQAPPQPGWDGVVGCKLREIEVQRNLGGARYGWRMMSERLVDVLARIS